jgi:hypothetical protein
VSARNDFLGLFLGFDQHPGAWRHLVEESNQIVIPHANAAMAGGRSNRFFVIGPVNVDETATCIGIVLFQAVEPEDARENKIVARRRRVVGRERDAAAEHRATRRVAADLLGDLEFAERSFHAAFFRAQAVARGRDRIAGEDAVVANEVEALVAH